MSKILKACESPRHFVFTVKVSFKTEPENINNIILTKSEKGIKKKNMDEIR